MKYKIIYADPAWEFRVWSRDTGSGRSAEAHYRTMPLEDICRLPVQDIAAPGCVLFLWGVWPSLPDAFKVLEAWDFEYKTLAWEWVKLNKLWYKYLPGLFAPDSRAYSDWLPRLFSIGMGYYTRANPEPCLLAIFKNGKKHAPSAPVAVRNERNLLFAPLREHSQKPLEAYEKINRLYPNAWPRLEMFARNTAPGWDFAGNHLDGLDLADSLRMLARR